MSYIPVNTTLAGLKMTDAQREALIEIAARYDRNTRLHSINVVTGRTMHLPENYIGFELNGKDKFDCILVGGIDPEGRIST